MFELTLISGPKVIHVLSCMVEHKGNIWADKNEVLKTTNEVVVHQGGQGCEGEGDRRGDNVRVGYGFTVIHMHFGKEFDSVIGLQR